MKKLLFLIVLAGLGGGTWYWYQQERPKEVVKYRTTPITRGDILATITATGTVEPEEVVDVGAQVAGKIDRLGRDPSDANRSIDYGSQVEEGTVLAQIDDAIYKAQVDQAKANLSRSQADMLQWDAKLSQAEREWERAQNQHKMKVISAADFDLAKANHETARAQHEVGKSAIVQAQAALNQSEINLGYTTIRSPVKGVILDRRVNVGQTVVASLNAPSLFLIAKDLKRMQVWASVNEADIGQIREGQQVQFMVDAYPSETFEGSVSQIRYNATMTQNVVTYTVVVSTDNSSGKLLPYLTANVRFDVDSRRDVLTVATAALRWQPKAVGGAAGKETAGGPRGGADGAKTRPRMPPGKGRVWIQKGNELQPVEVKTGLTDGANVEIEGEGISEGLEVVVGEIREEKSAVPTSSPFAPRMFGAPAGGASGGRGQ